PGRGAPGGGRAGGHHAGLQGHPGPADPLFAGGGHRGAERPLRHRPGAQRQGVPDHRAHRRRTVHQRQGPAHQAQDHRSEGVYQVRPEEHRHHRRGPGGHRQDVSGRGRRRAGVSGQAGEP
ncbi:DUF3846 domain-containing protein, partial [Dysosmobacter welbionis]